MFQPRRTVAIFAIGILIPIVYIFSITPYLLNPGRQSSSPSIEIAVPAVSVALILAIVFLVPSRKAEEESQESMVLQNKGQEEEYKLKQKKRKAYDMAEHRFHKKSLLYGAIGGFIAALVLVGLIFLGDASLGFSSGTLYSIIGSTMAGLSMPYSLYFGISMHLVTGTLVGLAFGYVTAALGGAFDITSLSKGTVLGILAGFASFSLLFIPITRFGVQDSLMGFLSTIYPPGTNLTLLQNKAVDTMSTVLAGAIVFHVIYGAIMGAITSTLLLRRSPEGKEEEEDTKKKVVGAH